jgi:hypothetical protein
MEQGRDGGEGIEHRPVNVMPVPGISIHVAMPCPMNRDGRDKPGHDDFDAPAKLPALTPHRAALTGRSSGRLRRLVAERDASARQIVG